MNDTPRRKLPKKCGAWVKMDEDMYWRVNARAEELKLSTSAYVRMMVQLALDRHDKQKETENGNEAKSKNA